MKGTAYRVQGTVLLILLIALTIRSTLYAVPSYAQDSTPSSSLSDKLNQLKSEIASKAAQLKTEVTKKVQNKAFIGKILLIDPGQMTIQTPTETRTIKYDEFTKIIGAKNKEIKIDTLEVDDTIAALGDVDDKNNVVAQELIYQDSPATISAQLVWGQIQKSSGSTIAVKTKDGQTKTLTTTSQTQYFLGNNEASIEDAKVEQYLIARGLPQKDGSLRTRFIYFIPSTGFTKPSEKSSNNLKASSPSAKPN